MGLTAAVMGAEPPTLQSIKSYEPFGVKQSPEMLADMQLALAEYQRLNTLLYRIVRPSLLIGGAHLEQDLERMRGWELGTLKDGNALLGWCYKFVDVRDVANQSKLKLKLFVKLPAGASLDAFEAHSYDLWKSWQ